MGPVFRREKPGDVQVGPTLDVKSPLPSYGRRQARRLWKPNPRVPPASSDRFGQRAAPRACECRVDVPSVYQDAGSADGRFGESETASEQDVGEDSEHGCRLINQSSFHPHTDLLPWSHQFPSQYSSVPPEVSPTRISLSWKLVHYFVCHCTRRKPNPPDDDCFNREVFQGGIQRPMIPAGMRLGSRTLSYVKLRDGWIIFAKTVRGGIFRVRDVFGVVPATVDCRLYARSPRCIQCVSVGLRSSSGISVDRFEAAASSTGFAKTYVEDCELHPVVFQVFEFGSKASAIVFSN